MEEGPVGTVTVLSCTYGRARVIIAFSDGTSLALSPELQSQYGLFPEQALDSARLQTVRREAELASCREKALDLVARAPHTRAMLDAKLRKRGYGAEAVAAALERLAELGYLDDRAFAERWVAQRMARHPEGRRALFAGLLKHGVPRSLAREVMEAAVSAEQEQEAARRVLERLLASARGFPATEGDQGAERVGGAGSADAVPADAARPGTASSGAARSLRERLVRKLSARGFDAPVIFRILEEAGFPPGSMTFPPNKKKMILLQNLILLVIFCGLFMNLCLIKEFYGRTRNKFTQPYCSRNKFCYSFLCS